MPPDDRGSRLGRRGRQLAAVYRISLTTCAWLLAGEQPPARRRGARHRSCRWPCSTTPSCRPAWRPPSLRERPADYGQLARRRLLAGAFIGAGDYVQATRRRLEMIAAVEAALREVDVLLCASAMDPPSRIKDAATLLTKS